ncbi:MAG: DUF2461 domain-containing protein [Saprospiraceae bacterium]|nr:DUF2461 domain-containing protein [Saprospiraceae bacterium]
MPYFTPDFVSFFRELAQNNNRDWFQANKPRFEKQVKQPFAAFIQDVINRIEEVDHRVVMTPKDAIFQLHRDTRFSQDKTPYKTYTSAIISAGGKKNTTFPGLYLQLNHEQVEVYSGVYMPEKEPLQKIREHIAANQETFAKLIADPVFVEKFGSIRGEVNKRLPKELEEPAKIQPLIYNKAFYYFNTLPTSVLFQDDLVEVVMAYFHAAQPLGHFFEEALLS